jgi:mRNA-degrading endonuclease RelE of RelBE toxin-antitoxin system
VISHTTSKFRKQIKALPPQVQKQAKEAFKRWLENPRHPSLQFKQIHQTKPIFSARVGLDWRAVGMKTDEKTVIWYWIGSHANYDQLIAKR